MNQYFKILIFPIFFTYSCQPSIELNDLTITPKLVIWGNLHPDSVMTIYLSRSVAPLDYTTNRKVSHATVLIFENNILLDTLKERDTAIYVSNQLLKPKEGSTYYVKVLKTGFESIETLPDTMPFRPKLIRLTTEELKKGDPLAKFEIQTNQPSHFKNYGTTQLFSLKWQVPLNTYIADVPEDCDGLYFARYTFLKPSCHVFNGNYKISTDNFGSTELKNSKVKISLAAISGNRVDFFDKINALEEQFKDYYSPVNVFWNPIYLPSLVKGGYGYVGCFSTLDIEVQF